METKVTIPQPDPAVLAQIYAQRTLIDVLLEWVNRAVGRKRKLPAWLSAALLCGGLLLAEFGLAAGLREHQVFRPEMLRIQIMGMGLAYVSLLIFKTYTGLLVEQLAKNVLGAFRSAQGAAGLLGWFKLYSNVRLHALFCIVYGLGLGLYSAHSITMAHQLPTSYAFTGLSCLVAFIWGIPMYWLGVLLALPFQLGRQEYVLFKPDPASSAVVTHLAEIFMGLVYLYGLVATGSMFYLASAGLLTPAFWAISIGVAWLPIILLFMTGQWALRRIVQQGRHEALGEVQARIMHLQATQDLSDKAVLEQVNRLLDYHERLKASRSVSVNWRAGLDFLNSLLLPLIGAIIGNVSGFLELLDPLLRFIRNIK